MVNEETWWKWHGAYPDIISFSLSDYEGNFKALEQLQSVLKPLSIEAKISEHNSYGNTYHYLVITLRPEVFGKKVTRNAGRKRNYHVNPENLSWGEVKKLKEASNSKLERENLCDRLKMSVPTFYRHYKEFIINQCPDDVIFY